MVFKVRNYLTLTNDLIQHTSEYISQLLDRYGYQSELTPATYNFDPEIAQKTCAKSGCHQEAFKQFRTTLMGTNFRQRTMRTWMDPYGPHNCGPSFADLPPAEILKYSGFDYRNTDRIRQDLNVPFTQQQARDKQRICNTCHSGCLDCHYTPQKGKPHEFSKTLLHLVCLNFILPFLALILLPCD